jgi:hypothetical protein
MVVRRRSPGWVRQVPDGTLHGICWRLHRGFTEDALTPAQDWLLTCVLEELGYRRRHAERAAGVLSACRCELCRPIYDGYVED